MRFDTIAVRGGYDDQQALNHSGAICEPAYLSPAQHFDTAEEMRQCLLGKTDGWVYTRIDNPTVRQLETTVAALESYGCNFDANCCVFSSGMAAIFMAANALVSDDPSRQSSNIVIPAACYGGSHVLFKERFEIDRGVEVRRIKDTLDLQCWQEAIDENTRFVLTEVPSNPILQITDIEALSAITTAHDVPLMVDATLSSPALLRPLQHGADIVVHSVSKSMSASGLSIAGAVVSKPNISIRHPRHELKEDFAGFLKRGPQRDCGVILSPFNALQSLSDLRSLRSRMNDMSESAEKLALFLSEHGSVQSTFYPGLLDFHGHEIAKRSMFLVDSEYEPSGLKNRYGYLVSVQLKGGFDAAVQFIDGLKIFWRANDLGRVKSTATIPAISTHSQLSEEEKSATGIPTDLVRLSVGCENYQDILTDVEEALANVDAGSA